MRNYSRIFSAAFILCLLSLPAIAQESAAADLRYEVNGYESAVNGPFEGVPTDWSSRQLVFSRPAPGSTTYDKVQRDARYWLQAIRRNHPITNMDSATPEVQASPEADAAKVGKNKEHKKHHKKTKNTLVNDWTQSLGSGGTVGNEMFPAKFAFTVGSANCDSAVQPDYVVYNTSLAGSGTQASIIAFDNLYTSGCIGTVPMTYWAYNTGGKITTSVSLSADGSQVAFVQSVGTTASLILLKWKAHNGTLGSPVSPTSVSLANYRTCTVPCMTTLTLSGSPNVTNSQAFYGFSTDTIYVGADNGTLHKFTNVFKGTPAEAGSPWPFTMDSGVVLSGPVFDAGSGNVFVGDASGNLTYVKDVGSSVGVCSSGSHGGVVPCIGTTNGSASGPTAVALGGKIVDPALVDGSIGKVIFFDGKAQASSTGCGSFGEGPCYGLVAQTNSQLGGLVKVNVGGPSSTGPDMHAGAFDNTYINSNPGSTAGTLYFCGKEPGGIFTGGTDEPSLYNIGFSTAGVMNGTISNTLELTNGTTEECSPATEFDNSGTDRLFVSVQANGTLSHCSGSGAAGACIYSFDINTFPTDSDAGLAASGGTSGIVIDNASGLAGASQVYYSTLTGSTAVQAAQNGL